MKVGGYGRLKIGDYCHPRMWRNQEETGGTRYHVPVAPLADSLAYVQPPGALNAWPMILATPLVFNRVAFISSGAYPDGRMKFGIYGNRKDTVFGEFFPASLLWQSDCMTIPGSGLHEQSLPSRVSIPANTLLWQSLWYYYTELGGGSMAQLNTAKYRMITVFGNASPDGTTPDDSFGASMSGFNPEFEPIPDPFPVDRAYLQVEYVPMIMYRLV